MNSINRDSHLFLTKKVIGRNWWKVLLIIMSFIMLFIIRWFAYKWQSYVSNSTAIMTENDTINLLRV